MREPTVAAINPSPPPQPDLEATAECPVLIDAAAETPIPLEAAAEILVAIPDAPAQPRIDDSAMADPHSAHSPMSPDDRVSDQHVGLSVERHSTGGTTPLS